MEVLTDTLLVNLSSIICVIIALSIALKSQSKHKRLFVIGLLVFLSASLLAIPLASYWQTTFTGKTALYIACNVIGILSGIGVIIMAKAFKVV